MKNVPIDSLVNNLTPKKIREFILLKGWKKYKNSRKDTEIFYIYDNNNYYQVKIPFDHKLADYRSTIVSCIKTLALFYNQSYKQIVFDISNLCSDIIRVRINNNTESGFAKLDDFVTLSEQTNNLIKITAKSKLNFMGNDFTLTKNQVNKFMESCKVGQSEVGSYVIPVVCPIYINSDDNYEQIELFQSETTGHLVIKKLLSDLHFLQEGISSDLCEETLVEQFRERNISSYFCESLNKIIPDEKSESEIEFLPNWSPLVVDEEPLPKKISVFSEYNKDKLREVSLLLKKNETHNKTIIGKIKKLNANPDINKRDGGTVYISYQLDINKLKTIKTELNNQDYNKALEAHEEGKTISIKGTLSLKKRGGFIDCAEFKVID